MRLAGFADVLVAFAAPDFVAADFEAPDFAEALVAFAPVAPAADFEPDFVAGLAADFEAVDLDDDAAARAAGFAVDFAAAAVGAFAEDFADDFAGADFEALLLAAAPLRAEVDLADPAFAVLARDVVPFAVDFAPDFVVLLAEVLPVPFDALLRVAGFAAEADRVRVGLLSGSTVDAIDLMAS